MYIYSLWFSFKYTLSCYLNYSNGGHFVMSDTTFFESSMYSSSIIVTN